MALVRGQMEVDAMSVHYEFSSGQVPIEGSDLVGHLSNSGLLTLEADSNSLPGLKRALSVPTTSSPCSLDKTTTCTKPTFRIQLPSRTPTSFSLPTRPTQQLTPTTATRFPNILADDPLFLSFRSTALLTPPDERPNSPLDTAVNTSYPLQQPRPFPSPGLSSFQPSISQPPTPQPTDFSIRSQSSFPTGKMAEAPSTNPAGSQSQAQTPNVNSAADGTPQGRTGIDDSANASDWLASSLDVVLSDLISKYSFYGSIKVLSQALPCPTAEADGSSQTQTAYPLLINSMQERIRSDPSLCIMVTHALPSQFSLTKLPTSPPVTPSHASTTTQNTPEDYFSIQNVYSSAVPVIDRHEAYTRGEVNVPRPSTPSIVVPPSSVNVALLERFIPPASAQEYADLFAASGPSSLVDRLVELSSRSGTMLFVYPTHAGAKTFTSRYLGPILDPLLRSMLSHHHLSADLAMSIGTMAAVREMATFEQMKRRIEELLRRMSGTARSGGSRASFELVYAGTEKVRLERKTWVDWWVHQETPRVRDVTTKYIQRARHLPAEKHVTHSVLTREIVEGVAGRRYDAGGEPGEGDGVEVGVFGIRKVG